MIKHLYISIDEAIVNAKDLKIRDCLKSQKAKGYEVLPLECCSNFDYTTGCKGHETEEECDRYEAICKIAETICKEESTCEKACGINMNCKAYQKAREIYEEIQRREEK